MDSKITAFPNSDQPGEKAPDNQDKDFLAEIEKLEKDSDLFASYIHNGPSEDPLVRRYQENLVAEFEQLRKKLHLD